VTAVVGFSTGQSVYAEALVMTASEGNIVLAVTSAILTRACALIPRGHELAEQLAPQRIRHDVFVRETVADLLR
jgi:hypothetical protein